LPLIRTELCVVSLRAVDGLVPLERPELGGIALDRPEPDDMPADPDWVLD
jgi:hypothetical protein